MKKLNLAFMILFALAMCLASCGGGTTTNSNSAETETVVDKSGSEYTSAYICPMYCKGSGSAAVGKCPTCEMAYVQNKNYKANGHNHSHDHHGHDHGDHEGHSH